MISRLIAKGIIKSFSMRKRRAIKPVTGIISDCDVCGGFMFNAQRFMSMNDAHFVPSTIPHEVKKVFDRILHELQYFDREYSRHFTLDLDRLDRIFGVEATSFPLPV